MSEYKIGDKFVVGNEVHRIVKISPKDNIYTLTTGRLYFEKWLDDFIKLPEFSQEQTKAIDEIKSFEDLKDLATEIYEHAYDGVFEGVSNKDFFLALAYDYSVKKEKKYMIVDKRLGTSVNSLTYHKRTKEWSYTWRMNEPDVKQHFTEQELRDAGFGHEFETMAVEVEE